MDTNRGQIRRAQAGIKPHFKGMDTFPLRIFILLRLGVASNTSNQEKPINNVSRGCRANP
jgi:hypothetical protein